MKEKHLNVTFVHIILHKKAIWKHTSLCQKYPYKARKKCMEKTSWHNDYYYISMQISQENKKIPADFKDLPGWKNDIPSNVSNQKNNFM